MPMLLRSCWTSFPNVIRARRVRRAALLGLSVIILSCRGTIVVAQSLDAIPINRWVKLSPRDTAPPSPRLGYEGACVWDGVYHQMIRYGGHNQGGGGEQHAETWSFDPRTARWNLFQPNLRPPGICCGQQNVFDPVHARYIRFPAFSHSHGWQWLREIYLNNSSVWSFDPAAGRWTEMRPFPAPHPRPLRCASWDSDHRVIVLFGGEGSHEGTWTYDPARNEWKKMNPPVEPAPRSGGNMAYDAARKRHILFGSQFTDDPHTWAYDLEHNRWTDMRPPVMPPTERNDAVLAYDSIHQIVLAVVKSQADIERQKKPHESSVSRLETWAYDTGRNRWTRLQPTASPDPSGNRARQLMFVPEYNVFLLENCTRPAKDSPPEQQVWAYRYGTANAKRTVPPPPAPVPLPLVDDLVVSVRSTTRVELHWTPVDHREVAGYRVERAPVEVYSTDQLVPLKSRTPPLDEPSVGAVHRIGRFTVVTPKVITEPHWVDDGVDLSRPVEIDGEPLHAYSFSRQAVDPKGKPYRFAVYAYRVRIVERSGTVGGPSPAVFTFPGAVQYLFSREDGTTCHLRWNANPERGIAGYRVYRIDGRWAKTNDVRRLTAAPITDCTFADPTAGTTSRRYHVVAVDVLGQEGHPSPPVWYRREWERFYVPFVDRWHQ